MHIYAHIVLLLSELIRKDIEISTNCGLTNREVITMADKSNDKVVKLNR